MGRFRIRGENGAETVVKVPGPGIDQRTFDRRVDLGEWTVLQDIDAPDVEPEREQVDVASHGNPEPSTVDGLAVRPPEAGPGASRKAWAAYAAEQGVTVGDDDTRDDIIAKIDG